MWHQLEMTSGKIFFIGRDMTALSSAQFCHLRTQMQIVHHDPWEALNPKMPIGEISELHSTLIEWGRAQDTLRLAAIAF